MPRTAGERRQHNAANKVRKVTYTGHARDKELEANRSQWQWVQHWLHQTRNTGQLLALTQWKTAGMLVDSGCTDHIVTNIDAFLDFKPIQSVVRNPNGEAYRVVGRGCVRITIPSNEGKFQCELKNVFCVPDYSSYLSASKCTEWGHSFTSGERKQLHQTPEGNSGKTNTRK